MCFWVAFSQKHKPDARPPLETMGQAHALYEADLAQITH
jgi:hypothetical protein